MITDSPTVYSKQRIRYAVLALFVAQGLCFASWASRLPDIKTDFKVESFLHYGLLMFLLPLGKFVAIPFVGFLLPRIGSKKTVLISILLYTASLFLISLVPGIYGLGITLFLFGTFWNMTDISLNTQAIEVERIYGKSILASFHASWSLSACIGAVIGYTMINLKITPFYHFLVVSIVAAGIILVNYKYLQDQKPQDQHSQEINKKPKTGKFKMPERILIQLGIVWLLALIVENTMFEWSDVYFQSVIAAPKTLQVGLLVFMVMMFTGRLLTTYAYRIWSKETVLQIAGALIFVGFVTSSLFIEYSSSMIVKVIINSVGFMLIGLGISSVVPTIYSLVGDKANTPVGTALTIMSSISFVGPLVAPLLVGGISDKYGLQWAYLAVGLLGACIILIPMLVANKKQ